MDISEAISGRRSTRDYTAQAVDDRSIRRLIEAAVHAPSASNGQPWTFTVVRDQGLLDRISQHAKSHLLATLPAGPRSDRRRTSLSDPDFHLFYHAPALILISGIAQGPWIVEDCALAAQNLMLAAYGDGLGTCWIGLAQGFLGTQEGKSILGLPVTWVPVAPIIVGHPRTVPAPAPRKEPEMRWVG
ncbi:MAG: nitroreductase [Chloroflexota bacterium]